MQFTFPDWVEKTRWRYLCHSIPEFLNLYTALRDLQGKKIHQKEARAIAELYDAAVKGVDEWERKRVTANGNGRGAATTRPLVGAQRVMKAGPSGGEGVQVSMDAQVILAVVLNSIVKEVDDAGVYHLYPFAAAECRGVDHIVNDLQGKSGFARHTGKKIWENDLPTLSQLYIYGHCEPGLDKMHDDTKSKVLTTRELASRLITCGLQKDFSGRVKIYGCSSGKAGNVEDDERAFADVFAQDMRNWGYHDCEFFGYGEDLRASNQVQEKTGHKYTHTKENLPYATSYRNPGYCEQVVEKALKKVYRQQPYGKGLDAFDLLLKENEIREAVNQARITEARVWYRDNEKRASEVRVQF